MSRGRNNRHYQFDLGRAFLVLTAACIAFAVMRMLGWSTINALVVPYAPVILVFVLAKALPTLGAAFERRFRAAAQRKRFSTSIANWRRLAARDQLPPEPRAFVSDAMSNTYHYLAAEPSPAAGTVRHFHAEVFCETFLQFADDCFGAAYVDVLKQWDLGTSEKLGVVVYALVAEEQLLAQEGDRQSDFDGQFDLTQPPR